MLRSLFVFLALISISPAATGRADETKPRLVMLIAEREYDTEVTLPRFAEDTLSDQYAVSIVGPAEDDRNAFDGIEKVQQADVLLVSVRRRTLPAEQLAILRQYVASGKPVIGIRTANHAFSVRNQSVPEDRAVWPKWDQEVFGGNYTNHHGRELTTTIRRYHSGSTPAGLLAGIPDDQTWTTQGSLYKVSPLATGATVLLRGSVPGQPSEPVAWTFQRADGGASFYTSLGHRDDFDGSLLPQLLANAIAWSLTASNPRD
ncbi:ThuA domain-containing protein [Allorhodopirellula solitaria]|uniref:Trehalose utilization n=1 Tax=Allorhodopirellula solitaria TaxID=2527987 RepID=A0A5C5WXM9_9BACT|nr:ThuA domain-containing protein [Allorhodopirellula solitaria]TWT55714.1 Trehalose utilization [Allorhodopirellula solitaria]